MAATGGFAAGVAALRACVLANYRHGDEGRRAVRAAIRAQAAAGAQGAAQGAGADGASGGVAEAGEAVEMAFRQVLNEDLMARALPAGEDILDEGKFGVRALLDLSLGLVAPSAEQQQDGEGDEASFDCPGKRTPFLLLEDVFDVLGVAQVEEFWPVVEEKEARLYSLFPPGSKSKSKLIMLKICNSLLRRLSKSHNTALCGRLMMYLSRNWDLSEPSALNKSGLANVANQTVYEDGEEFERQQALLAEKQRREEELRLAVAGQQEQHQQQQQEAPIDYALYQSFWGLQERLSEPAKLLQGGPGWDDLVGKAKTVLQAFEGFTVSEDSVTASAAAAPPANKLRRAVSSASLGSVSGAASLEGSEPPQQSEQEEEEEEQEVEEEAAEAEGKGGSKKKRSRAAMEGGGGDGGGGEEGEGAERGAYLGCKYLTNSRLFRLQLHDPLVRVQVLTQVLIVLNYVQASQALTKAAAANAAASTPAASPTVAASSSSAAHFKSALSATATAFTPGAGELRAHARRLIRAMPQHGPGYLKALDAVLDRERQWLAWKQVDKCASKIERPLPPGSGAKEVRARPEVKAALQAAAAPTLVVRQQRAAFFGQPLSLPRPVHLETIKKEVRKAVDLSFESEIIPRVQEAMDPENCIDEEYHPRHEPVFCWRALRLAATAHPEALIDLETGSLDALCERAAGIKPPPPKPKPQYIEEEAEEGVDDGRMEEGTGEEEPEGGEEEAVKPEAAEGGGNDDEDADSAVAYVAKMAVPPVKAEAEAEKAGEEAAPGEEA